MKFFIGLIILLLGLYLTGCTKVSTNSGYLVPDDLNCCEFKETFQDDIYRVDMNCPKTSITVFHNYSKS